MAEIEAPLMPKAVAVWLIDNTALTFDQIAKFCNLHPLEIKGIADGEVAKGVAGCNPITMGQITREEIDICESDPERIPRLMSQIRCYSKSSKKRKSKRYTPIAKRRDKPDAVCWLLKNCPEMPDSQIAKLIGTTKGTIQQIKNGTHWNASNIKPRDPVLLGLCKQSEIDEAIMKVQIFVEKARRLRSIEGNSVNDFNTESHSQLEDNMTGITGESVDSGMNNIVDSKVE